MNLQYITDSLGKTTGVFIPIEEWTDLKTKLKGIDWEEIEMPEWQISAVRERLESYRANPNQALDFDSAMDQIEKDL